MYIGIKLVFKVTSTNDGLTIKRDSELNKLQWKEFEGFECDLNQTKAQMFQHDRFVFTKCNKLVQLQIKSRRA